MPRVTSHTSSELQCTFGSLVGRPGTGTLCMDPSAFRNGSASKVDMLTTRTLTAGGPPASEVGAGGEPAAFDPHAAAARATAIVVAARRRVTAAPRCATGSSP